jgi:hypothetical protein
MAGVSWASFRTGVADPRLLTNWDVFTEADRASGVASIHKYVALSRVKASSLTVRRFT